MKYLATLPPPSQEGGGNCAPRHYRRKFRVADQAGKGNVLDWPALQPACGTGALRAEPHPLKALILCKSAKR